MARRLFQLVEPIAVVTYMADEPTEAVMALGLPTMWDAYFAGRAAPLGRDVPAAVVHALFYNFADGEVARHIPRVWDMVTPEDANAARQAGLGRRAAADPRRPRRHPRRRPCRRPPHQGGDQRADGGTGPLRRRPDAAPAHRTGGAALARGQPAPRAPRRRPRRRTPDRGHRRDGGARAARALGGHAGGEVWPGLPPAPGPAGSGRGRDARPRPRRRRRLAHRRRPAGQGTGRIAHRPARRTRPTTPSSRTSSTSSSKTSSPSPQSSSLPVRSRSTSRRVVAFTSATRLGVALDTTALRRRVNCEPHAGNRGGGRATARDRHLAEP